MNILGAVHEPPEDGLVRSLCQAAGAPKQVTEPVVAASLLEEAAKHAGPQPRLRNCRNLHCRRIGTSFVMNQGPLCEPAS